MTGGTIRQRKLRRHQRRQGVGTDMRRRLRVESLEERAMLATFTVTNVADSGAGSLRQAIMDANANPGLDDIEFNIPGAVPHTIQPLAALPALTDQVFINGYSQPGASANTAAFGMPLDTSIQIEIDGINTVGTPGFSVQTSGAVIRGLAINRFGLNAIRIQQGGNVVGGNFLGTDVSGQIARPNGLDGVLILDAGANTIGGLDPADANLISGNLRDGVLLLFESASDNLIRGNYIGTNRNGDAPLGNANEGVEIVGGSTNSVLNNLISSNFIGVRLDAVETTGNLVENNLIGTDRTGLLPLGNGSHGIVIDDASSNVVRNNRIGFNLGAGVVVTEDTAVQNRISQNAMFNNTLLGIDLGNDGMTLNDADDPDIGPNRLQNFPAINSAFVNGANLDISYSVPSLPANSAFPLTVEFFIADSAFQEGQTFIGSDMYAAPGAKMATFPLGGIVPGTRIVATATDAEGNTSEFSFAGNVINPMGPGDNDSIATATVLGSPIWVTINDQTVGDGDQDFYKLTAHFTGKLLVTTHFSHALGDIDLEIQDMNGSVIASSASMTDNEMLTIPVVTQEMYFIRVFSNGPMNRYDLEIENFAAPVPTLVKLTPGSDTGMFNHDGITTDTTPDFWVTADLSGFFGMGITLLNAAAAANGLISGVGVELVIVSTTSGAAFSAFADPLDAAGTLWIASAPMLLPDIYLISARTLVVDGQTPNIAGRTTLSAPTMVTIVGEGLMGTPALLLESSDTGMLNNDNVTQLRQPAFTGMTEPWTKVDLFVRNVATGTTQFIGSTTAISTGEWLITSPPLNDGTYDFFVRYTNLAGISVGGPDGPIEATRVIIDTVKPNTPYLDLISDSGRSNSDNVTNTSTPTLTVTINDTPNGNGNPFPNDLKYRIFVRPDGGLAFDELLLVDSFMLLGDFTTGGFFEHTVSALPDGVHNFKLEVEDRAGNISHQFLLNVTIDTTPPVKSFGEPANATDGLAGISDTGIVGQGALFADRITSDATPTFWGYAEANAIVRLFVNTPAGQVAIGQAVAQPFDGNGALPDGRWEITSTIDLASLGLANGVVTVAITAEDVAGNVSSQMTLDFFLDTQGPRVALVEFPDGRSVFGPKPTDGPSPITNMLVVTFVDAGTRLAPFNHQAVNPVLALDPRTYEAIGDANGQLLIESVEFVSAGIVTTPIGGITAGVTYTVKINFFEPLPDDRITLRILDRLADDAGNQLDGDARSNQPGNAAILLPSGDGVPGGTFEGRFTVDARPEIGSWSGGSVYVDTNGNFRFDPDNPDATNRDIIYTFGFASDDIFSGNFSGMAQSVVQGSDAIFVVDVSGSTSSAFGGTPVGDLNNDGIANTILDAQIAALIAVNNDLIARGFGTTGRIAIVAFDDAGAAIDMNPATAGVQLTTSPSMDADSNGVTDVEQALRSLQTGGLTNFESALATSIDTFTAATMPTGTTLVFLSDGFPTAGGTFTDEVATLQGLGVILRAFGVGPASSLAQLQLIDPMAVQVNTSDDLLDLLTGQGSTGSSVTDGFDKLAAYGDVGTPSTGSDFRWLIDVNNDGVPDINVSDPANINGLPFAGRFDDSDGNGDEVGVFDGQVWWFDTNHDFQVDTSLVSQLRGYPIVGDFDGDGFDDLATYNEQLNRFEFDLANGVRRGWNGTIDHVIYFGFPGVRERPVAADINGDGVDDIGLWVPDRSGVAPEVAAEWYFLVSQDGESLFARIQTDLLTGLPAINFTPKPFGPDVYAQFGDEFALPIVGNFDPPVGPSIDDVTVLTNPVNPLDVDNNQVVTPLDALLIINMLSDTSMLEGVGVNGGMYPDVNGDGTVTPLDALMVINALVLGNPMAPLSATVSSPIVIAMEDARDAIHTPPIGEASGMEAIPGVPLGAPSRGGEADQESRRTNRRGLTWLEESLDNFAEEITRQWSTR